MSWKDELKLSLGFKKEFYTDLLMSDGSTYRLYYYDKDIEKRGLKIVYNALENKFISSSIPPIRYEIIDSE